MVYLIAAVGKATLAPSWPLPPPTLEQAAAGCSVSFWRAKCVHPAGHVGIHGPLPAAGEGGAYPADMGTAAEALLVTGKEQGLHVDWGKKIKSIDSSGCFPGQDHFKGPGGSKLLS